MSQQAVQLSLQFCPELAACGSDTVNGRQIPVLPTFPLFYTQAFRSSGSCSALSETELLSYHHIRLSLRMSLPWYREGLAALSVIQG